MGRISLVKLKRNRDVPAVGSKLTYRVLTTTKTPSKTIGAGQIYTYIVTSSDGATAEGVLKPVAIVLDCPGGAGDLGCEDAAKTPDAHFDGHLLTVPVSGDAGDGLAAHGSFKLDHFILVSRKLPIPSSRDPGGHDLSDFGPDPAYILSNSMQCDMADLQSFLPFGKSPRITLACETVFERSASRDGHLTALNIHDTMKNRDEYQRDVVQNEFHFQPGSTWIVFTDQVSHAAMGGQHLFEQTFYLPVRAMADERKSPLRVLERGYALVYGQDGKLLRAASQVVNGEEVVARLAQGRIQATVTGKSDE